MSATPPTPQDDTASLRSQDLQSITPGAFVKVPRTRPWVPKPPKGPRPRFATTYTGPRGGLYVIQGGKKVYLSGGSLK